MRFESYPDFRPVLHSEADVVLAEDRHEIYHNCIVINYLITSDCRDTQHIAFAVNIFANSLSHSRLLGERNVLMSAQLLRRRPLCFSLGLSSKRLVFSSAFVVNPHSVIAAGQFFSRCHCISSSLLNFSRPSDYRLGRLFYQSA